MTEDILSRIVAHKKQEVAEARGRIPDARMREQAMEVRKRRPFLKKLAHPGPSGINIIAEIKRASPSRGLLRPDLDPAALAAEYEAGGAAAISVLTDRNFFRGGPEDLKAARSAASLPVLRKDFLVSEYQIFESAASGADAVLLIVRILEHRQLKDYLEICNELGLDALVEVHSEKDVETATRSGARLIGINNRNLRSFETDINTAVRMNALLAPDQIAVAASGIQTREDIEQNTRAGIRNFLIGESLVRSADPRKLLRTLQGMS